MGPEEAGAGGGRRDLAPPMVLRNHRVCRVEGEWDKCASQQASQEPVRQPQARTGDKPQETLCLSVNAPGNTSGTKGRCWASKSRVPT